MDWGMKNRMSRLIKPEDGRAVWLAVDHGYFLGPLSRLEEPAKTITPLLPYTDALMLTRGVLRNCVDAGLDLPMILRVSGGNSIVGPALSNEAVQTSVEEAILERLLCAGLMDRILEQYLILGQASMMVTVSNSGITVTPCSVNK